jgi:hypothetical protein
MREEMAITFILIAIFFSITVAIFPIKIGKVSINIALGPIIVLIMLFVLKVIDLETVKLGIVGNSQLRPWEIIIIFFTAAYVSISVDVTGILGFTLANIINNQPMTILLSSMLTSESFHLPHSMFLGGAYAVIIASNLGANLTLIGALAGLMWKKILQNKNLDISYISFLRTGIMITPIVFACSLVTLYFVLK